MDKVGYLYNVDMDGVLFRYVAYYHICVGTRHAYDDAIHLISHICHFPTPENALYYHMSMSPYPPTSNPTMVTTPPPLPLQTHRMEPQLHDYLDARLLQSEREQIMKLVEERIFQRRPVAYITKRYGM